MADDFTVSIADADQWRVTFAGVQLTYGAGASGLADGEWFKLSQPKASFTTVEGTDGTVARSKTNTRIMEGLFRTLQTNAQTNGFLSAILQADEQNPNGAGIAAFVAQDLNGTTRFKALKAWISTWPDQSFDRGAKEREWKLTVVRSTILVGGN